MELQAAVQSVLRGFRRRPFQSLLTILVLSLGLSSSIAVATYVNGFYQPFPGVDSDRLMRLYGTENEEPFQDISYLDFLDYSDKAKSFEGLAATQPYYAASVRLEDMTEVAFLEAVSGDYFSVLKASIALGRGIMPDDDRQEAVPVAVVSHDWWQRTFNSDESIIGRTIFLNYRPFIVAGVAGADFLGTDSSFRPDVWIPIAPFRDRYVSWAKQAENRDVPLIRVYGRLRGGISLEQAQSELTAITRGLDDSYPRQTTPRHLEVGPSTWIDPRARLEELPTVRLMILTAGVLLLLVCANLANLFLALTTGRQREMGLRAALGSSPARLLRLVFLEIGVLATVAGALSLLIAAPLSSRLGSYFARPSVWGANVARTTQTDGTVVAIAVGLTLLVALLAGLAPAVSVLKHDLLSSLRSTRIGPSGHPRSWGGWRIPGFQNLLVATQAGLSVVLLVVAGLVVRTLLVTTQLDPGFGYDDLIVTHISTSSTDLKPEERERFFRELADRLGREPWVSAATVAGFPPLSPHPSAKFRIEGQTDPVSLVHCKVHPGFFEALGIPVTQGRSLGVADREGGLDVAVVNESFERRFFPGQLALGRRIWWPSEDGTSERPFEIVGVSRDVKTQDFLTQPEPTIYFSYPQHAYPTGSALLVRVQAIDPASASPLLYRWLRNFEPHLAIVNVVPYSDVVAGFLYTHRMNAEMFSALAAFGLTLALVGVFSVTTLTVSRRTREIGIRMSVGALRSDISRMVLRQAIAPVVIGLAVGLGASAALAGWIRGLLFGVEPYDPFTLATAIAVLGLGVITAAWIPSLRATAVDPVKALRTE